MNPSNDPPEAQASELLEALRHVPPRNPEKAAHGRAHFLALAAHAAQSEARRPAIVAAPVSTSSFSRLSGGSGEHCDQRPERSSLPCLQP